MVTGWPPALTLKTPVNANTSSAVTRDLQFDTPKAVSGVVDDFPWKEIVE